MHQLITKAMYFTQLPDHTKPGFNEQLHFSKFRKHNMIFNALSNDVHCDHHTGCLSLKTVFRGEEWYGVNHHHVAIRPGQFLILNDNQTYSCHIDHAEGVRSLSIFFKKEFASAVFHAALHKEETLLNDPFNTLETSPEFFQTLYDVDAALQAQLHSLVDFLNRDGYQEERVDEYLVDLLHHLIERHQSAVIHVRHINAVKSSTRTEIYKRLCVAKDVLHSFYMEKLDLDRLSGASCLSVPQLIRQFKSVFRVTPHQYLVQIRLLHATELLKRSSTSINDITWKCGFENVSAFCRAFKSEYKIQPGGFRKKRGSSDFNELSSNNPSIF